MVCIVSNLMLKSVQKIYLVNKKEVLKESRARDASRCARTDLHIIIGNCQKMGKNVTKSLIPLYGLILMSELVLCLKIFRDKGDM